MRSSGNWVRAKVVCDGGDVTIVALASMVPRAVAAAAELSRDQTQTEGARTVLTENTGLFIGGTWRPASDGGLIEVQDPANGKIIAEVASGTVDDALAAVAAAQAALPSWRQTPPRERSEILRRAFELMTERREQLAELIVRENGKALTDARSEVVYAAEFFRWYAEEAVRAEGSVQTAPGGANKILVLRQAVGVALLITPWNFPAAMATRKIGPALAAGCTVILKPASDTPLTALALGAILAEAGAPPGIVNVLPSRRSAAVGEAVLADPRVRKLSFTGSTEVGRGLLAEAAKTVVNCSMELGGNAPFVVLADADLDQAVAGAMVAKMRNGGEACTSANRFYVHASIAGEFAARFATAMEKLTVGPGLEPGTDLGPLVNAAALEKVSELVEGAIGAGARVLTGARALDRAGYFYLPTVLGDVPPDAPILGEEIFGPVAPVVPFDTVDEAVAMANDTEFGLVSYLYTGDLATGLRVCEALEAGMIGLNRPVVSDPAAPFGGVKQSGIGREGGHDGLLEFTETKYIAVQW
ncbi:MAG: succinate semialdehyde dehydrogenase [Actinomycetia bacterium]|nr:succinate semialdehyde dehydrogenase [Actinomycetes bacterium]